MKFFTPTRVLSMMILALVAQSAFAVVDMKSANFSESWTDLKVPGIGYDLRVTRTYNSRSLFDGMFGFGWCSDFETKITVTPEGNLKLTECGGGMEITYMPKSFKASSVDKTVQEIMAEVRKRRSDLKPEYLNSLEKEMKSNDFLREEFSRRMHIQGKVAAGKIYYANGREAETIVRKGDSYKRSMTDGTYQLFDVSSGHITHMYDRNGNYLKFQWKSDVLESVADNMGRKLSFKYSPSNHKIAEIVGPNGLAAHYVVKGEDLVRVIDSKKHRYGYAYDDVHNLTKIELPDHTYKALTYNKDKDWVTSFRDPKGCVEKYDYEMSKDDPKNHFWSKVLKKCGERVTNHSTYEFFHKPRPDGLGVYLYRVKTDNNGEITDIIYHEKFGKPISILKNNYRTDYTYYGNGYVRTKREPGRLMEYDYRNSCRKVSQVKTQYFTPKQEKISGKKEKDREVSNVIAKTITTKFFYDKKKCNLVFAQNSEGQKVKLRYDTTGRIALIEDQSRKLVKIKYENRFGKPAYVTRPGLGTIHVSYKSNGDIDKVKSQQGASVAIQVASIFNNLLDIIAPATSETSL